MLNKQSRRPRQLTLQCSCPSIYGQQTAGGLLRELQRRDPNTEADLTSCYWALCAEPCTAVPCCRPDYRDPDYANEWDRWPFDLQLPIVPDKPIEADKLDHMQRARQFRDACRPRLRYWRGDFWDWEDMSYYLEIGMDTITAEIWNFLETTVDWKGDAFKPNSKAVNETVAALKAVTSLDDRQEPPFWIDGQRCGDLIAFPNALLLIDSGRTRPPNPNYFTLGALAFDYAPPSTLQPEEWLRFLDEIFDGERSQILQLQEMMGYQLTSDISLEKALLLLGPSRSGKGTILNMMRSLLASTAIAGPTLQSLSTTFGLQALIGKLLAIIDDLRVSRRDAGDMVANVLKITGRGFFTFDRKYKSHWNGQLPVKLVLTSNVMPKFGDDSPALAHRIITIETKVSFLGREDPELFERKLRPERLQVLHWALAGLRRLRERGGFRETLQNRQMRERMASQGSLVHAFVADECELDEPDVWVEKDEIYAQFKRYAKRNDSDPDTKAAFCEALYAATGGKVRPGRPWLEVDGERVRVQVLYGIRLKT